jgi:hypothetical protein
MKHKYHTAEQIVNKLRQADVVISSGGTLQELVKNRSVLTKPTAHNAILTKTLASDEFFIVRDNQILSKQAEERLADSARGLHTINLIAEQKKARYILLRQTSPRTYVISGKGLLTTVYD